MVISCEHAGRDVPPRFARLFATDPGVLDTHRGYDIGIAAVAQRLAESLGVPLLACPTSRLLIETNRSLHHPGLFSEFSRSLKPADKAWLIEHIWRPHREAVAAAVGEHVRCGRTVLHLAMHSFTPVLNGQVRTADIGLLYDPRRQSEARLAPILQQGLRRRTGLRIRRNYPYRGAADGMTTSLRRTFASPDYLGFEVEINQALLLGSTRNSKELAIALGAVLQASWPS